MTTKNEKGFFEKLGASMDDDLRTAKESLSRSFKSKSKASVTYGDVIRELLSRVGKDVTLEAIDETFEYNDIVEWVQENHVGNKFYIAIGKLENSSDNVLCVFFSNDDELLIEEDSPKRCCVYKKLSQSISALFNEGNSLYVKSFKVI